MATCAFQKTEQQQSGNTHLGMGRQKGDGPLHKKVEEES